MQENYDDTIVSLLLTNDVSPEWESWQEKSAHARRVRETSCASSDFCIYADDDRIVSHDAFFQITQYCSHSRFHREIRLFSSAFFSSVFQ